MKIIYNKYIPFKGFVAINLCGYVFVRRDTVLSPDQQRIMIAHESVHSRQMKRDGYVLFYARYLYEYIRNLIKYKDSRQAYYAVSYEQEAYGCGENSPN